MKPAPPPEQDAFVMLQRAAARLMDGVAELLRPYGLRPPQYNVLRILRGAHPQELACHEIAARMMTREPDLTRLLDRLEAAGLAKRTRQASDRRVVRVGITRFRPRTPAPARRADAGAAPQPVRPAWRLACGDADAAAAAAACILSRGGIILRISCCNGYCGEAP